MPQFQRCQFCSSLDTLMVIKEYVVVNEMSGILKSWDLRAVDTFRFEDREKIFSQSIVIRITWPWHRRRNARILESVWSTLGKYTESLGNCGVAALQWPSLFSWLPVWCWGQDWSSALLRSCRSRCCCHRDRGSRRGKGILARLDIGNVRHPLLVWTISNEVSVQQIRITMQGLSIPHIPFSPKNWQ